MYTPDADDCLSSFAALPRERLPASAWVDFLHLVALGKPAVRVRLPERGRNELALWCELQGYRWLSDLDGYFCVAPTESMVSRVLEVDRQVDSHEFELGLLLGYPPCCCEVMAQLGESNIDERALRIASWNFNGRFSLIDPSGYLQGGSLICRLPCSAHCEASLEIAVRAGRFLRGRLMHPAFASWLRWEQLL